MRTDDNEPRRRRLNEDERALWRSITRSITPLRRRRLPAEAAATSESPARNVRPAPSPGPHAVPARAAPAPKKPAPTALLPLDRRLKQRLARGAQAIDARLDLHGRTQGEAHAALLRFLQMAQANGAKVVLVITGKGGGTGDVMSERGVLKRQVPLWLRLPEFHACVLGVYDAHVGHGGAGALYVRIRRRRSDR